MDEEIKKIIEDNKEKLDRIDERVKKIHKKLIWHSVAGYIKAVLILGPIIIGIIYLSPLVKKYFKVLEPIFQTLHLSPENNNFNLDVVNNLFDKKDDDIYKEICNKELKEEIIKQVCE